MRLIELGMIWLIGICWKLGIEEATDIVEALKV